MSLGWAGKHIWGFGLSLFFEGYMAPDAKVATYLRAILRADDLDKAKQEARLALKLIEKASK